MSMEDARPPYVVFETRAVEDRTASVEHGTFMVKDVDFAVVTPAGTRDRIEKEVEAWLKGLEEGVQQERIPANWPRLYREAYKGWKEGQEIPEDGTSVRMWTVASPAQVKAMLDANIRTVEDMAVATEEALSRIGMGASALKQRAKAWLDSAKGQGKLAQELATLRTENEQFRAKDEAREEELKKLKIRLEALETRETT